MFEFAPKTNLIIFALLALSGWGAYQAYRPADTEVPVVAEAAPTRVDPAPVAVGTELEELETEASPEPRALPDPAPPSRIAEREEPRESASEYPPRLAPAPPLVRDPALPMFTGDSPAIAVPMTSERPKAQPTPASAGSASSTVPVAAPVVALAPAAGGGAGGGAAVPPLPGAPAQTPGSAVHAGTLRVRWPRIPGKNITLIQGRPEPRESVMKFTRRMLERSGVGFHMTEVFMQEIAGFVPRPRPNPREMEGWCFLMDGTAPSVSAGALVVPLDKSFVVEWYLGVFRERDGLFLCEPV